jgi:hypothetical protein
MLVGDLSTFADQLRKEGFDARNLGQVGITVWEDGHGVFLPAEELRHLPREMTVRDFEQFLNRRKANGGSRGDGPAA